VVEKYTDSVILFRQENQGPAVARNFGIDKARGELIAFLDGDDKWFPDKLKLQCDYMADHPEVGLVFSDGNTFTDEGIKTVAFDRVYRKIYQGNIFDRLLLKNYIPCIAVMVRKKCLDKVGLFPENFDKATSEDWHLWLRVAKEYRIGYIAQPLVMYRWKPGSLTDDYVYAYPYRLMVLDEITALYPGYFKTRRDLVRCAYSGLLMRYGYALFKSDDYKTAAKKFILSIHQNPLQLKSYLYLVGLLLPRGITKHIARLKIRLGIKFMPAE